MTTRVLLVEDDEKVSRLLARFLQQSGFDVTCTASGEEAISIIRDSQPDVVLLDLKLPDIDGISVCEKVRDDFHNGILMLTANESEMYEVMALNAGIDDFMTKPAKPHILMARLQRIVDRQKAEGPKSLKVASLLFIQDLEIDFSRRIVFQENTVLQLSESEFELLGILAKNVGNIVSRDDLFSCLRGTSYNGSDRAIDMRISKLRQKLALKQPDRKYISTIRNKGYVMLDAERV